MKQYLIIGGSSGIGKALANQLNEEGNSVTATYNTTIEISREPINYIPYDVEDDNLLPSDLPEVIDGLIYCPGRINLKPFHRLKKCDFREDYEIQVIGAIDTIQQVLPNLKKSDNPSIVLFSTVAVQSGFTFHSAVSASKGAIEGLTRALAAEFAPKIRVNAIAPSITHTSLTSKLLSTEEKITANAQRHPLKKIGSAEEVASLAAYLLSEKAAWMTGQILTIDGGISTLK